MQIKNVFKHTYIMQIRHPRCSVQLGSHYDVTSFASVSVQYAVLYSVQYTRLKIFRVLAVRTMPSAQGWELALSLFTLLLKIAQIKEQP